MAATPPRETLMLLRVAIATPIYRIGAAGGRVVVSLAHLLGGLCGGTSPHDMACGGLLTLEMPHRESYLCACS